MKNTSLPASAGEALAALHGRSLGARELTDAALELLRISTLGAVEILDEAGAREQASSAEAALARGAAPPLTGLPVLVKDVIDVEGVPTRGGTAGWVRTPSRDAVAVAALRAAGAIVIGKAHTNELAFGIDGRNPHRPPCLNPHARDALPGGSSSGPAVALAGGLALGALGTDTSGSIRVPAALCGIAGLRPSHGCIALDGVLPLAPSYDVVGPMATCVADLQALFAALLAGAATSAGARGGGAPSSGPRAQRPPIRGVSVIETLLEPEVCEPAIAALVLEAAEALRELGLEVRSLAIPAIECALEVHRDVQLPEAARSVRALGVAREELGEEVRARVRSADLIDADRHAAALLSRDAIAAALEQAIGPAGVLLAPGCPVTAPARDAEEVTLAAGAVRSTRDVLLSCTVPLTQAPGPVLALPIGRLDGMPVGAQLLAAPGSDARLLELGIRLERELAVGP